MPSSASPRLGQPDNAHYVIQQMLDPLSIIERHLMTWRAISSRPYAALGQDGAGTERLLCDTTILNAAVESGAATQARPGRGRGAPEITLSSFLVEENAKVG